MADMSAGIVMNGPMPIIFVMFSAVACSRLNRRSKCGSSEGAGFVEMILARPLQEGNAAPRGVQSLTPHAVLYGADLIPGMNPADANWATRVD